MNVRLLLVLTWLSGLLVPSIAPAQDAKLSSLTDAAFSKWLTGTEWKGEKDGKRAHLWFATPGIVIWRWEFNPGVWDCRAAALVPGEKGKMKWRWNPEAVASCTLTMAEDLKTLTLEDGLCGKWALAPSARKAAVVMGGKLATMGAGGFSAWLEKQALRWRDYKLDFGKGRTVTYNGTVKGSFEITSPGVVEVYPVADRSYCLLVVFSPSLETATVFADWGVSAARVKGAPAAAPLPSPAFNDPAPSLKTLAAMKKEDFEKWLVGTEWEMQLKDGPIYYWFPTPGFCTWRRGEQHLGMGAEVKSPGYVEWFHVASKKDDDKLTIAGDLVSGNLVWNAGTGKGAWKLLARRMPFPMHVPSAEKMAELLPGLKVDLGGGTAFTMPRPGFGQWHDNGGKAHDRNMTIPGPGMFQYSIPGNQWDAGLFILRQPDKAKLYWIWGNPEVPVGRINPDAVAGNSAGAASDMGLGDTKPVPVKNPTASVNALVVVDVGGGRMAGSLSKLSLTSLALTKEDPATLGFNQTVGADMKKALREVSRYHAIRQQGWPRGQKMELSFADKYSPKDGPSAAVACGLLLESAIRGVVIQPDFAVTGDMNADGSVQPIGGVAAKLRGATKGGCTYAGIPEKNVTEANDLILTDGPGPFLGIQVFTLSNFDDAAKLAVKEDAQLRTVMDIFKAIAATVKTNPAALRQAETIASLRTLTRQVPNHLSARLLLALAEDKLPATLSPSGSLNAIELSITDALESTSAELLAKSSLDRGKVSSARSRLQQLRSKLDKRTLPLTDAWVAWCQSVERITAAGGKVTAQSAKEHNATVDRIRAEENKLSANADFREDLMK